MFIKSLRRYNSYGPDEEITVHIVAEFQNTFPIFFECSPSLMRILEKNNIEYCNIRVHPVRFASDLMLSFYFSNPAMQQRAQEFAIHKDFLAAEIAYLRSYYGMRPAQQPENALIFLAQSSYDTTLILGGKYACIQDYKHKIDELAQGRKIYIKPHPDEQESRIFKEFMALYPDAEIINNNTYQLLASCKNCEFITLSSGSGHEAELLGHKVHYLMARNFGLHSNLQKNYAHITHAFWAPSFWEYVLQGKGTAQVNIPFVADRLRKSCGAKWSKEM